MDAGANSSPILIGATPFELGPGAWLRLRPFVAAAAAAVVAVAIQSLWLPVDADVSWLITVCERVLSGDRLYVDIFEVNPPASVWLYLPLVWLAGMIGAKPEAVVVAAFVAGAMASVFATLRLSARLDDRPHPLAFAAVLAGIALVLPMGLFAQREHAAVLLALPALTALAIVADSKPLARRTQLAAGFAAGLVIVIKPHFLLAIVAPALWAAFKRRSLLPLLPGIAAASVAIGLYAVALLVFAGDYLAWLPVITSTYAPMHEQYWKVAVGPALYPAVCLGLAWLLRPPRIPSLTAAWALGSAGFLLAAYAQAKNYPNHWLPQASLALAAAYVVLALPQIGAARRAAVAAGLGIVALSEMHHWAIRPDPAVAAAVRQVAPAEPKIIALSPQLVTGHPVTRNVGGTWAGSRAALFTAGGARFVGLDEPIARRSYREDIGSFAKDVERHSPDVVLVHVPSKGSLMSQPEIGRTMAAYRFAVLANSETEVWVRRTVQR